MARALRIQFPGAIYHAMARGNARMKIFLEKSDYSRFLAGLEATVDRFGFEVFSFVCMPNHIHMFFRTPEPNLSRGMQYLLSGYANWFNTRHRRSGHVFQGRFKGELIEDERYYWNVSRYIHLNPVRGKRPLVQRPEEWHWSSYPGYRWKSKRVEWVAYDSVFQAWQAEHGGKNPEAAYRQFVNEGVETPPENPLQQAVEGWLLGSSEFVERIKQLMKSPRYMDEVPAARRLSSVPLAEVLKVVADHYGVPKSSLIVKHSKTAGRDIAAWVARRVTTCTLRELSESFGLGHPDSIRNLIRRTDQAMEQSPRFRNEIDQILRRVLHKKPKNRV